MSRRTRTRLATAACCLASGLPLSGAAAAPRGPQLRIVKIRLSTYGGRLLRAVPGETVRSCSSDPIYSVSFDYGWARMREPGTQLLVLDGPGKSGDVRARSRLFETRGDNAMVETAEQFEVASHALPAGAYRFEARLDGLARAAAVTVTASAC